MSRYSVNLSDSVLTLEERKHSHIKEIEENITRTLIIALAWIYNLKLNLQTKVYLYPCLD